MMVVFCRRCKRTLEVPSLPYKCTCGRELKEGRGTPLQEVEAPPNADFREKIKEFIYSQCGFCEFYPCLAERKCAHFDELVFYGASCPLSKEMMAPRWISNEQRLRDVELLIAKIPASVTAVAGIPRSGLTPAMMIAERLHLFPYVIHEEMGLQPLPYGWRMRMGRVDDGMLLVVDDTLASGAAMQRIKEVASQREHLKAVVYLNPQHRRAVNLFGSYLFLPHYLEWNFFNSIHSAALATDLDGILADEERPDHPVKYLPKRHPLKLIVTGREECHREETEQWLRHNGIVWERLEMWPYDSDSRWVNGACAKWKGEIYLQASECKIFTESCPHQAKIIAAVSKKRVICPATAEIWG